MKCSSARSPRQLSPPTQKGCLGWCDSVDASKIPSFDLGPKGNRRCRGDLPFDSTDRRRLGSSRLERPLRPRIRWCLRFSLGFYRLRGAAHCKRLVGRSRVPPNSSNRKRRSSIRSLKMHGAFRWTAPGRPAPKTACPRRRAPDGALGRGINGKGPCSVTGLPTGLPLPRV